MFLKMLTVGELAANCYILACEKTKEAVVIDPGGEAPKILRLLTENKLKPMYIINTHGHIDHIGANEKIKKATGAPILIHQEDAKMLTDPQKNLSAFFSGGTVSPPADRLLKDRQIIKIGKLSLKVLHTPGHTPGGICLKIDNKVFTGDTLFAESIGRTDLPLGSYKMLITSIKEKLLVLDDDVGIFPGHGPTSTIGLERANNPFLQ